MIINVTISSYYYDMCVLRTLKIYSLSISNTQHSIVNRVPVLHCRSLELLHPSDSHRSGINLYLSFSHWLMPSTIIVSELIHIVTNSRIFIFILLDNISLYVYIYICMCISQIFNSFIHQHADCL
jgi:hypothetical protein